VSRRNEPNRGTEVFSTLSHLECSRDGSRHDADVVQGTSPIGAPLLARRARGADAVARIFNGRARETRPASVDGLVGAAYAPGGTVHAVYAFRMRAGRIVAIEVLGPAADRLVTLD